MINKLFMKKIGLLVVFIFLLSYFSNNQYASASATVGTIDPVYKYAWGQDSGWLNFGCDNCQVVVTDTTITGNVWSVQYGWINLQPDTSGVTNNSEGVLVGSAWGKNIGWIDFAGVRINSSGEFLGYATVKNDNSVISFNCLNTSSCGEANFKVKTDWRPASSRTGGGGGGYPPPIIPPIVPPVVPPTVPPIPPPEIPPIVPPVVPPTVPPTTPPTIPPVVPPGINPPPNIFPIIIGQIIDPIITTILDEITTPAIKTIRNVTEKPVVKTLERVSVAVPVAISTAVLVSAFVAGLPFINYLFYLLAVLTQLLGIRKTPKPWGTVYDAKTKRPIPFARVEILNRESRKLQSVITDENGRYGFLMSDELARSTIELKAFRTKYDFPSRETPTDIEQQLYPNIYKGGLTNISGALTNFDIPMDPRDPATSHNFYFGIISVQLNNALVDIANILFVVGVALGIVNFIANPNGTNLAILGILLVTFIVRQSGFKLKPFGLTKDKITNETIPFGFVALHTQNGERINFTVSDDKGRYFLLSKKGGYILKAYTPAHILPTRTKEVPIFTTKGWVSKEIEV
ncbi:carboxypeptidase regulatory-like domain-containing protein [Candidatus Nomurabacteria bacterium]|nr:carboxypeptidase regulatory-like domain-containing protein [Candidatus Nomurabacteria bacterium]